ncbi:hypothetical protein B0T25DRAFT_629665 [Lasiosphaeria hispida]|uniref:Uncharacterized protein n=1 Tax=Lasiosphaeria hispida TaxID=260671 RepID=A0AAJ0HSI2_9PEZI|nr:hypothetical protein B0T25DRAFT_629665 [Lasiosphaeria hispida]
MMKLEAILAVLCTIGAGLGAAVTPQQATNSIPKVEILEAKNFRDLGAKRARITYGPYVVPGSEDATTHGMKTFQELPALMPCRECLITSYAPDLVFADGKPANANREMWLHHIGLSNMNRTDTACASRNWPERISVNGNERSSFDMTVKGTQKAGYYVRKNDTIFLATDAMNIDEKPQTVYLAIDYEYIEGTPDGFDIVFPVWLDFKGNCLNESTGAWQGEAFEAKSKTSFTAPWSANLILMVPHTHDGNTKQEVFLNGTSICQNVPGYGETAEFVSHVNEHGHDHDHGSSEHVLHVSSISQCSDVIKTNPRDRFTISSTYSMKEHPAMKDHDGSLEPIMGIEFLHFARPRDEAIKDILAMPEPNLQSFLDQVAENNAKPH